MHLTIKNLAGELSEQDRRYLRGRFLWLKEHMENSAELTVGVKERVTKRSNQAYEVVVHLSQPGIKKPIYVKVSGNDFKVAVDLAKEKVERIVLKNKERGFLRFRIPKINLRRKK
jgi:ribosome-associated translation inhibitor RaiA